MGLLADALNKPVDVPEQTQEFLDGIDLEALNIEVEAIREKILSKAQLKIEEERKLMIWARTVRSRTFMSVKKAAKPAKKATAKVKAPSKRAVAKEEQEKIKNMSALDLLADL